MKGLGAVEFGDLPEMAEVVVGKLVEHLRECDRAQLVMPADACGSGGGNSVKIEDEGPAESDKFLEVLTGGRLLQLGF